MKKGSLIIFLSASMFAASAQKVVLVEQFTNSGCPPCAAAVPPVSAYVNQNEDKVVMIAYHASFPYLDSMYHENKVDNDAAVAYGQVSGVPFSIVDGIAYRGTTSDFGSKKETIVAQQLAKPLVYNLAFSNLSLNEGRITGQLLTTAIDTTLTNLVVKIAVIEHTVLKSSYKASPGKNSEKEYHYVMRKMLPSFDGTVLTAANQAIDFEWDIANIKNTEELRVVAFVQNTVTKEIYQTVLGTPEGSITSGVFGAASTNTNAFVIYPNPTKNELIIATKGSVIEQVAIVSIDGKLIRTIVLNGSNSINTTDLPAGTYLLKANLANGAVSTQRFVKE